MNSNTPTLPRRRRHGRARGPRILCVDDDGGMRSVVCEVLTRAGFCCETVAGGQPVLQRLTKAARDEFDVFITDHVMPGLNGVELISKIRRLGLTPRIIVHSWWLRQKEYSDYEALHVDAIVMKHADTSALLQTVVDLGKVEDAQTDNLFAI